MREIKITQKCKWFVTHVKLLGHEVSGFRVWPNKNKEKNFKKIVTTKNKKATLITSRML